MIVIIPDTNVLIKATFNDIYDGIHIHDKFYTESSQLLDVIKDEKTSSVSGGLLPTVEKEYNNVLLKSALWALDTVVGMQQMVKEVAREIEVEVTSRRMVMMGVVVSSSKIKIEDAKEIAYVIGYKIWRKMRDEGVSREIDMEIEREMSSGIKREIDIEIGREMVRGVWRGVWRSTARYFIPVCGMDQDGKSSREAIREGSMSVVMEEIANEMVIEGVSKEMWEEIVIELWETMVRKMAIIASRNAREIAKSALEGESSEMEIKKYRQK